MLNQLHHTAEDMIRHNGGRATAGRIGILAILLAEQQAITHREIEQRLPQEQQLDRVTLYRALEWLAEKNLIHKVTSDDRAWRYHANRDVQSHQHAHFKCTCCAQVICLDKLPVERNWPLPAGYRLQEIELTVKGLCANCC
ncbi:Fur family transcriptional regulator [Nitrosomonas oligotropha]|uniref:Fur family transcriptional regulator n=1 Tax=Nitrosomonas oligotropha TaxID=42354 RepID=UPI00136B91DF|nr:transcriptional repressor [Nitrosomonas oligotropha]MXS83733.1 transcriptional repressor [Nitrosomonas oligotropha]